MPEPTSIKIYHEIRDSGLLSELRGKVYRIIVFHGPGTQKELFRFTDMPWNSYSPRFTELEELKVIEETCVRPCNITGNDMKEYQSTQRLPIGSIENKKKRRFWIIGSTAFFSKEAAEKYQGEDSLFTSTEIIETKEV